MRHRDTFSLLDATEVSQVTFLATAPILYRMNNKNVLVKDVYKTCHF